MIELRKFQRRPINCEPIGLNFEHASVALLARYKVNGLMAAKLPIHSEWRDPAALRHNNISQGAHRHG